MNVPLPPPPFPGEKPFTGLTAALRIGEGDEVKTVAYVSGVDMTLEKDIIEILAFGMEFKEKVPAIKDWSISIDGTVSLSAEGSQKDFYDAFTDSSLITVGIFLDETTYFAGKGYVASYNISAAPDDAINLTSEIAGNGAVVLVLPDAGP